MCLTIIPAVSYAQEKPQLQVLIEKLPAVAEQCGIRTEPLRARTVLTLRRHGIETASQQTSPYLYVNLNLLHFETDRACAYSLHVSVKTANFSLQRGSFRAKELETVLLCERGGIAYIRTTEVARDVANVLEMIVEECLAELAY